MIVVDASVVAKWFLPEAGSEEAIKLLAGTDELFAPTLIRIEVLGAITRRFRMGFATREESIESCNSWLQRLDAADVTVVPEGALLDDAVLLALSIKHTLHDCFYLAAAKQLDTRLLTADRTFYERAKPSFKHIDLLPGCSAN